MWCADQELKAMTQVGWQPWATYGADEEEPAVQKWLTWQDKSRLDTRLDA